MPRTAVNSAINFLTQKNVVLTTLIASIMLIIFVTDLQFTTQVYISVLYVIVVMLSLWLPSTPYIWAFAGMSSVLAIFGSTHSVYSVSPLDSFDLKSILNLSMAICVIWITALIAIHIKRMSLALAKSDTIYKSILNASIDPVFVVNTEGNIESVSKTVEVCLGWEPGDLLGKKFSSLLGVQYRDQYEKLLLRQQNLQQSPLIGRTHEAVGIHRLRKDFPCEISINYLELSEVDQPLFTIVLRDITLRRAYEDKLGWMSSHDELTGIANRTYFNEHINKEWMRMLRTRESLSLIIIDVDFFKNYNDAVGHKAGDTVLQKIAAIINENVRRAGDIAARYGGEEFTILLPGTDVSGAQEVANAIKQKISELNIAHPNSPIAKKITVSIGISAMIPLMGCSFERLLRFADQALYEAKHSGRNKLCIHQE